MDGGTLVDAALSLGGLAGVGLSGVFVYWQIGQYAAPQVPRSLFDERKVFLAYTVGLFAGIPLALFLLFFLDAFLLGAAVAAGIDLALLVIGSEVAQWAVLRSLYFGSGESGAFYALALRAGISGLLILALVTQYFSAGTVDAAGTLEILVASVAVLTIEIAAALLSARGPARRAGRTGSPWAGGLFAAVGFFLVGLGPTAGTTAGLFGSALAALGSIWVYRRLRDPILSGLLPPPPREDASETTEPSPYTRISR